MLILLILIINVLIIMIIKIITVEISSNALKCDGYSEFADPSLVLYENVRGGSSRAAESPLPLLCLSCLAKPV